MDTENHCGALEYIGPSKNYAGCELYRERLKGGSQGIALADEADAADYARRNNLFLMPRKQPLVQP